MINDFEEYAEWLKTLVVGVKVAIMHGSWNTSWTIHTVTIRKPNGTMELTPAYSGQQPVKVKADGRIMPISQHLRIEPVTDDIRTTIRRLRLNSMLGSFFYRGVSDLGLTDTELEEFCKLVKAVEGRKAQEKKP